MHIKNNTAIIGIVLLSITSGIIGAVIVARYFLHPEDFCFCSQPPTNSSAQIPELARLKKFLGIKEDIQISAVYDKVKTELVGIYKKKEAQKNSLDAIYSQSEYMSSGFILTNDGWIVSIFDIPRNYNKDSIVVIRGLNIYTAEKIIADAYSGAVFVKIPANFLPSARLGSVEENNVGQNVIALSYSGGAVPTNIKNMYYRPDQDAAQLIEHTEKLSEYFLIKDHVEKSYDGGVVVNLEGEILGLIMKKIDEKKDNNVLMVDSLRPAIDTILKGGKISRPFFGIKYIDLSRAAGFGYGNAPQASNGIFIWEPPLANTPANKAGLRAKDIITQINGVDISGRKSFGEMIQEYFAGDAITLSIQRNGKEQKIEVKLGFIP